MPKNYLITGLPRSGTTLLTSLLSENIEAVTFSEPEWLKSVRKKSANCQEFAKEFMQKILELRDDIRNGIPVHIKTSRFNQGLPKNYYHRNEKGEIVVDKEESPIVFPEGYADKPFIIKANAQFTACLGELINTEDYKIICIVRNPVATIMSWRSLDLPVSQGNMKIAEKFCIGFIRETKALDLLENQVLIADWFFKQYKKHSKHINIIKYEDLKKDTKKAMSSIIPTVKGPVLLKSHNQNKHYNFSEKAMIMNILNLKAQYCKNFYEI